MSTRQNDYDVIVIGGGGAGLAAANAATDSGASVLIVDAADRLGGSTALSQGAFYAAGTRVQEQLGIEDDSADAMYRYAMALNQYRVDPALMRRFCDEATGIFHWLMSLGVSFPPELLVEAGVEGVARSHFAAGFGAALTSAMEASLSGRKADVALRTRVRKLLIEDGRVCGIETADGTVRAAAVVIASGGFGANPELVSRYYPEAAAHGDWTWYIGSRHCVGDGLALGQAAGADLTGHNRGLLLATAFFRKEVELPPGWLMMVNRDGRRFMDESVAYAVMSGVIKEQRNGECFAVFDHGSFTAPPLDPRFAEAIRAGTWQTTWTADVLAEQLKLGRLFRADTLGELAADAGIMPAALRNSVEEYNADCARGADARFFKPGSMLKPITEPPYYAARMRSSILCLTSTGLRIDSDARVLDEAGSVIPGLFAAGEVTGGVMGERYIGSGNSIAHVITYGRIAGRSAARQ